MSDAGLLVHSINALSLGFKELRARIEEMADEELIELYDRAKELANVSWLVRCLVLGTAKKRAVRGDGTVPSLAKEFGIGRRMAELDIQVYDTFIDGNPDFEPQLPAIFYQLACRADNPHDALAYALDQHAQNPSYPSTVFSQVVRGKTPKEKLKAGVYMLIPMEESIDVLRKDAEVEGHGWEELYGRVKLHTIKGYQYAEVS